MDKANVNKWIPVAYKALDETGIVKNNTIKKGYRGQISTLGAAITMGSLISAITFFKDDGSAGVERSKLLKAIHLVLCNKDSKDEEITNVPEGTDLFKYVRENDKAGRKEECKEDIINAIIALKLAMNLYELTK